MLPKRELQRLCEKWKELLRLRDWFIVFKIVKEDEDESIKKSSGRIGIADMVYEAEIELNSKLLENDAEVTVAHELAHIQVKTCFKPLRNILEDLEPEDSEVLEDILDNCEEEQVRHIEFLIARLLGKKRYVTRSKK